MQKLELVQKIGVLVLFVLVLASCRKIEESKIAKNVKIDLSGSVLVNQTIELNGQWEVYPNQILGYKDFLTNDSLKSEIVEVPYTSKLFNSKNNLPDTGFATYRLKIKVPKTGIYAIKYAFLYTSVDIFVNDKLVYKQGNFSPIKKENKPVYSFGYFPLSIDSLSKDSTFNLIIHASDFSSATKFGITKPLIFGSYNVLQSNYNLSLILLYFVMGILIIMFIYNFFTYIFYPKNISILFFALMTLMISIRSFFTSNVYLPQINFCFALRGSFLSAELFTFFTLYFYKLFFRKFIRKKILPYINIYALLLGLFYVFAPILLLEKATLFLYIFLLGLNTFFVIKLLIFSIKKKKNAFFIFIAQSIFYFSMINDMLFFLRITDFGYVSHYTISIFVTIEAIMIAKNLSFISKTNFRLFKELDYQNKNLEYLIVQRTQELDLKNKELTKLSLIAENSHNVIIIFDTKFNLQWANSTFEKYYNTTLKDTYNKLNLIKDSKNKNINKILEKVLDGQSITYISKCITPIRKRWIQTTLTPLIINNQINEIIAIESDISKIKSIEKKLKAQNIAIQDSLRYAKTIQSSILPGNIQDFFQHYIIYRPKQIVSGDFYFFKHIILNEKSIFITGVVDCTGHGVPGAFMSLIIHHLLDNNIDINHIFEPADIMNLLNKQLKNSLSKKTDEYNTTDGAAMVLLKLEKIDADDYKLDYSTANLSFMIADKDTKEVAKFKTNVSHLGWLFRDGNDFTQKSLNLRSGDFIYMYSDGFYDQLNQNRQKFGKKNFYELIKEVSMHKFDKQKFFLEDTIDVWQQNQEQYDDILIYAFELP